MGQGDGARLRAISRSRPDLPAEQVAPETTCAVDGRSLLLTFDVQPTEAKKGKLGISFLPENGVQNSCELQISLDDLRAQFGPGSLQGFAAKEKSLREGGKPHDVGNYAIENLIGVDKAFPVRVILKTSDKIGGAVIDAEIAGKRTMITYRPDLTVKKLVFRTAGATLKNVQTAMLKD